MILYSITLCTSTVITCLSLSTVITCHLISTVYSCTVTTSNSLMLIRLITCLSRIRRLISFLAITQSIRSNNIGYDGNNDWMNAVWSWAARLNIGMKDNPFVVCSALLNDYLDLDSGLLVQMLRSQLHLESDQVASVVRGLPETLLPAGVAQNPLPHRDVLAAADVAVVSQLSAPVIKL